MSDQLGGIGVEVEVSIRPDGALVGEGDMPAELDRLNWGALLLAVPWAVMNSSPGWLVAVMVLQAALLVAPPVTASAVQVPVVLQILVLVLLTGVAWAVLIRFASRANAIHWELERRRNARRVLQEVPSWPATVADYAAAQRSWATAGMVLYVFSAGTLVLRALRGGIEATSWVLLAYGLNCAIAASVYVWDRRRHQLGRCDAKD